MRLLWASTSDETWERAGSYWAREDGKQMRRFLKHHGDHAGFKAILDHPDRLRMAEPDPMPPILWTVFEEVLARDPRYEQEEQRRRSQMSVGWALYYLNKSAHADYVELMRTDAGTVGRASAVACAWGCCAMAEAARKRDTVLRKFDVKEMSFDILEPLSPAR